MAKGVACMRYIVVTVHRDVVRLQRNAEGYHLRMYQRLTDALSSRIIVRVYTF